MRELSRPSPGTSTASSIVAQAGYACARRGGQGENSGPECQSAAGMVSHVYAIGRIEARFPNLSAEKEFAQATGRTDTAGKT